MVQYGGAKGTGVLSTGGHVLQVTRAPLTPSRSIRQFLCRVVEPGRE